MFGLTKGTRHYIQFNLTEEDTWKDLLFVNDEGDSQGLWCSRSYSAANARIESLMAESGTDRSQYRIVRRTWDETIIEHDPNWGKSTLAYEEDDADPSEGDYDTSDEDAEHEAALEAQVDEVPNTGDGDDDPQFEVVKE